VSVPRPRLSPVADARLNDVERPQFLGASRQLDLAADLLSTIATEHQGDGADLVRQLREVAAYLVARRGDASQAFPNALALMLAGIDEHQGETVDELRETVIEQTRDFARRSRDQVQSIAEYGAALAAGATRILVFDFSSSVAAILDEIELSGASPTVVVPEARTLDGGRSYVEELLESRLPLELIPDVAVGSKVKSCQLALIGAETITAEGGCYNTTGSLLVALACRHWRVPLYSPTTLLKIDTRTLFGYRRTIPELDEYHLSSLTEDWPLPLAARVELSSPELDYVPPELMTGFITELGILPPAAIVTQAMRLSSLPGPG
jgi:translation initiation factor 2B subunit (eIF-2B alpha/beta/delta family)